MEFFTEVISAIVNVGWLTVIGFFVVMCIIGAFLEENNPGGGHTTAVCAILIFGLVIYDWQTSIEFAKNIPQYFGWVIIYLVVGAIWSVCRWGIFVSAIAKLLVKNLEKVSRRWTEKHRDDVKTAEINRLERLREQNVVKPTKAEIIQSAEWHVKNQHLGELSDSINNACCTIADGYVRAEQFEGQELTIDKIVGKVFENIKLTASNHKSLIVAWIIYWPISLIATFINEFIVNLVENLFNMFQGVYSRVTNFIIGNALKDVAAQVIKNNTENIRETVIHK